MCQGYESPCRAVPLALVAVYRVFLTVVYWNSCPGCIFTRIMARMILIGCFRHAIEYINNKNAPTKYALFSCVVTGSVKLVHGPLAS